ncbi:hypothetical protein BH11MYX3_BH11MYX3_21360 [soil metagenome]
MCHFITAAVPGGVSLGTLETISAHNGLQFQPLRNAFVEGQLPVGSIYLQKVSSHCDCGTVVGSTNQQNDPESVVADHGLEKLRRQGWSERKIERWQADKARTRAHRQRTEQEVSASRQPEASAWTAFLREVIEQGRLAYFGLLLASYRGGVASERITIQRIEAVSISALVEQQIMAVEERVLYCYQR